MSEIIKDPENEGHDVESVLGKVSAKRPEKITEMMAMMGGSMGNPLHNKMTPEHITQVLDLATKHDEREYKVHMSGQEKQDKQTTSTRRYSFATFFVIIVFVSFMIVIFRSQPAVLIPILSGMGGLLTGALGGYGFAKSR
jgi:UDP-N-acetylglucosamine:LPS N-acetylglucosamine transferase